MAERIDIKGRPFLRFVCECGQKQQSPDSGTVKCARCGKEHSG